MENYNAYSKNANVTSSLFTLQGICWISLPVFDDKIWNIRQNFLNNIEFMPIKLQDKWTKYSHDVWTILQPEDETWFFISIKLCASDVGIGLSIYQIELPRVSCIVQSTTIQRWNRRANSGPLHKDLFTKGAKVNGCMWMQRVQNLKKKVPSLTCEEMQSKTMILQAIQSVQFQGHFPVRAQSHSQLWISGRTQRRIAHSKISIKFILDFPK